MRRKGLLSTTAMRFKSNEDGAIALLFGLALVPLLAAGGLAVDYGRASNAKASIAASLDAGVLAAAKDGTLVSNQQIAQRVSEHVQASKLASQLSSLQLNVLTPSASNRVNVAAEGCTKAHFSSVLGGKEICFAVRAEAERPRDEYYEVSIVLDNSGSMWGDKLQSAKDAANVLIDSLFASVTQTGRMRVSIVPFALAVKVGTGYANATWADQDGKSSIHWESMEKPTWAKSRFDMFKELGVNWNGCFEYRPGVFGASDAPPEASQPDSLFVPLFAPDEPGERGRDAFYEGSGNHHSNGKFHSVPNSYLNDDGSHNVNYTNRNETSATQASCPLSIYDNHSYIQRLEGNSCRYKTNKKSHLLNLNGENGSKRGPNFSCFNQALMRMSTDKDALKRSINSMNADGGTNTLEGFVWGWRTLSPHAPFADGLDYNWNQNNTRVRKIIVLMTDGDNDGNHWNNGTNSRYSPFGYFNKNRLAPNLQNEPQAIAAVNAEQKKACNNAKAKRNYDGEEAITIYTVGFSTPGREISAEGLDLLRDCATSVGANKLYYEAKNRDQLIGAFRAIGSNITNLKLKY